MWNLPLARLRAASLFLLFAWGTGTAGAGVVDELSRDFAPAAGVVLSTQDGEVLVDLDATDGVMDGDLLAVVDPGEPVVHPTTGQVLGHRDRTLAVLRVTRVRSGFSEASRLDAGAPLAPGTSVRRFQNLPAVFIDHTGEGRELYGRLSRALPELEWQGYRTATDEAPRPGDARPGLVFELRTDGLRVRDGSGTILHRYEVPVPGVETSSEPPSARSETPAPSGAEAVPAEPSVGTAVRLPPSLRRTELPTLVRLGAFRSAEGRLLLAATDGTAVRLVDLTERPRVLAEYAPPEGGTVTGVHWWQPEGIATPYVAASWWEDRSSEREPSVARGIVLRWEEDRLEPAAASLPLLLGAFDLDGDGTNELLLGESFDPETFFGSEFWEVRLVGGEAKTFAPPADLPRGFRVQGSAIGDVTGDGRPEAVVVRRGVLTVYDGDAEIFRSARSLGGSLHRVLYAVNPEAQDQLFRTAIFEVDPVLRDLDGDGRRDVLAVAAEHSPLVSPSIGSGTSGLAVFARRDDAFVRGSVGPPFESPVQALHAAPGTIFAVVTRPGSAFGNPGASELIEVPVPR